jgi:hypothetical protein
MIKMQSNKFITILKSFSGEEIKEFGLFVKSPYHNRNNNAIKYYEIIRKYYPEFNSEQLTKENIYKQLYPEKKYNDLMMRILISDCIKLAEEYLIQKRLSKDKNSENLLFLKELSSRNLESLFNSQLKRILKNKNDLKYSNEIRFLNNILIDRIIIEHNIKSDKQELNSKYINDYGENLIYYFLTDLIKLYHDLDIQKELYNKDFDIIDKFFNNFNFGNFINSFNNTGFKNMDLMKLYYAMYLANKNFDDNDKNLNKFHDMIKNNINLLSNEEKYEMFLKLESIIIGKIERGRNDLYSKLFEVYEYFLTNEIYKTSDNEKLRIEMFRNIFFAAMTLGKLQWAENFIKNYTAELASEFQENMKNHCLAILYFAYREFGKSLEYASKVKFNLFVQKADIKILILKIYYELNEYEHAYLSIDTFYKFLTNNKNISELFKQRYKHFLQVYKMLIKYKSSNKEINKDIIELELEKSTFALSKNWLKEKINEL